MTDQEDGQPPPSRQGTATLWKTAVLALVTALVTNAVSMGASLVTQWVR